jgi:hypothetical protein
MRVRNSETRDDSKLHSLTALISTTVERDPSRSKFNASFEKKIEHLFLQSSHIGWSYNDFVVRVLEVLVILQQRESLKTRCCTDDKSCSTIAAH